MDARIIKSDQEYRAMLSELESLMDRSPLAGTPDSDRLELLAVLIGEYEGRDVGAQLPDPIEAIRFRMEQANLTQRDLVPFVGSRSKVSEMLSRKRPLTLSMIKALHSGLGIPARVLLRGGEENRSGLPVPEWERFPVREMLSRGWVGRTHGRPQRLGAADVARSFFLSFGSLEDAIAMYRRTRHVRSARPMDAYALVAWTARVIARAGEVAPKVPYRREALAPKSLRDLAKLSIYDTGPLLAREHLAKCGVPLVIEPGLPQAHLDGAAILTDGGRPVVGMTLRHDRIDNFWFSLMHELAHVYLHLEGQSPQFYDDLDVEAGSDGVELEADRVAGEILIPSEEWDRSPASRIRTPEAALSLAERLGVHPAIVAGRMRHHFHSYRILNHLVGHGEVRRMFEGGALGGGVHV